MAAAVDDEKDTKFDLKVTWIDYNPKTGKVSAEVKDIDGYVKGQMLRLKSGNVPGGLKVKPHVGSRVKIGNDTYTVDKSSSTSGQALYFLKVTKLP